MERYELATERIRQIPKEDLSVHFGDFFVSMAEFVIDVDELKRDINSGKYENYDFETLQSVQEKLYAQILPQNYNKSFFHPDVLFEKYGEEFGRVLCVLARQLRSIIPMVYERKEENISSVLEVFLEIYTAAQEEDVTAKQLEDIFFWYMFDYLDVTVPERVRETLTPQNHFIRDIIENADLNDLRYLFLFGQYVSNSEIAMAKYLNALPEETIKKMADTYTQGYQKGFVVLGKDLSKVKNVSLHCPIGFERVVKVAIQNFLDMGLERDVLLPFRERVGELKPGASVLVALYVDKSERIAATMRVYRHLKVAEGIAKEETVRGTVYELSDPGVYVAVDDKYFGLIPRAEAYGNFSVGQEITARVIRIREDGKLDLSPRRRAFEQMDEDAELLLKKLAAAGGSLPFHDRSEPAEIEAAFGISKSAFKRALGRLLKAGKIVKTQQGIQLKS